MVSEEEEEEEEDWLFDCQPSGGDRTRWSSESGVLLCAPSGWSEADDPRPPREVASAVGSTERRNRSPSVSTSSRLAGGGGGINTGAAGGAACAACEIPGPPAMAAALSFDFSRRIASRRVSGLLILIRVWTNFCIVGLSDIFSSAEVGSRKLLYRYNYSR